MAAARALGAEPRVVDPLRVAVAWQGAARLLVDGETAPAAPRHVIPRIGAASARASLGVLRHLELMGAAPLNPAAAIAVARDKLATAQAMIAAGIPVPASMVVRSAGQLEAALDVVGGLPVVMKVLRGSRGVGVVLLETLEDLRMHAQLLWQAGEEVLLQRFVAEAGRTDIRAIVVGDQVVAAMERRASSGEFRSNVHQGGTVHAVTLARDVAALAVRASRALGLGVGGVDLILAREGPLVLEVNASPGLSGIERATGVDVATAMVQHALRDDVNQPQPARRRRPLVA